MPRFYWIIRTIPRFMIIVLIALVITPESLKAQELVKQRIAVLPFINQTGNDQLDFLANGLAEIIKTSIYKNTDLIFILHGPIYEEVSALNSYNQNLITALAEEFITDIIIYGDVAGTEENLIIHFYLYSRTNQNIDVRETLEGRSSEDILSNLDAFLANLTAGLDEKYPPVEQEIVLQETVMEFTETQIKTEEVIDRILFPIFSFNIIYTMPKPAQNLYGTYVINNEPAFPLQLNFKAEINTFVLDHLNAFFDYNLVTHIKETDSQIGLNRHFLSWGAAYRYAFGYGFKAFGALGLGFVLQEIQYSDYGDGESGDLNSYDFSFGYDIGIEWWPVSFFILCAGFRMDFIVGLDYFDYETQFYTGIRFAP